MSEQTVLWTPEQVDALNRHQDDHAFHGYTCSTSAHGNLVATTRGWICKYCGYTQRWAVMPDAPANARTEYYCIPNTGHASVEAANKNAADKGRDSVGVARVDFVGDEITGCSLASDARVVGQESVTATESHHCGIQPEQTADTAAEVTSCRTTRCQLSVSSDGPGCPSQSERTTKPMDDVPKINGREYTRDDGDGLRQTLDKKNRAAYALGWLIGLVSMSCLLMAMACVFMWLIVQFREIALSFR